MNIGPYTFEEFKEKAREFHSYPAPGLLLGGYMVELAKGLLPPDTLYEAVVETAKCLPDAVQLLTPLSAGNNWMKVVNLGRYALALYDKRTGRGVRVWVDAAKLGPYPELRGWLLKEKPKKDQDSERLLEEIRQAGPSICSSRPVQVSERMRRKAHMGAVALCPACGEPFPAKDGAICRGCQGEAPYDDGAVPGPRDQRPPLRAVPAAEAVGRTALHDMTRIVPGESKGPEFLAGQTLTGGDLCRLQQMGRVSVYVAEEQVLPDGQWVHENEAALAFARRMAGPGVACDSEPREGKINFRAEQGGLLGLDREALRRFNLAPDVMCATRQGDTLMEAGKAFAACRAIPLYLSRENFSRAMAALGDGPLFSILPLRRARAGLLVTGTEVFTGAIEDRFIPILTAKLAALGSEASAADIAPDNATAIAASVRAMLAAGCDLIITTAGLSVDPDDVTRQGLLDAGLADALYGAPLLPGAMTLVGRIGSAQVLGVPACALFHKTTSLDLLLPRLLAGQNPTRADLARLAEGGFCLNCRSCTFPKCPFGK
ncbi:MAG: FmdE family protein [Thermodesulfobacteriota bacterium]